MSLVEVKYEVDDSEVREDIAEFIEEAESRAADYFRSRNEVNAFVPSDLMTCYRALAAIMDLDLAAGNSFCEWGSGFGGVTCVASMLGFEAHGIEIENVLIDEAYALSDEFELDVEWVQGNYIPANAEMELGDRFATDVTWMASDSGDAYDELGVDLDEFDVIFVFPWPFEEPIVERLFDHYAATGALLVTYSQIDGVRIRRKSHQRPKR